MDPFQGPGRGPRNGRMLFHNLNKQDIFNHVRLRPRCLSTWTPPCSFPLVSVGTGVAAGIFGSGTDLDIHLSLVGGVYLWDHTHSPAEWNCHSPHPNRNGVQEHPLTHQCHVVTQCRARGCPLMTTSYGGQHGTSVRMDRHTV